MEADVPILRVDAVSKAFGSTQAVDSVSLHVECGEVFGLLGPNGAGKSTLLRMLLDIYRPDMGVVEVFGHRLCRRDLDSIGYLPEARGLYLRRTVIQVLTYLGELKGLDKAEAIQSADYWLDALGMEASRESKIKTLSKGNQQKIQLISTLLAKPKLLIWDEPFSGLDPVNVVLLRDLIAQLKSSGISMILSTHLMAQAEALCDRVGLLHAGRLIRHGSVAQLRADLGVDVVQIQTGADLDGGEQWPMIAEVEAESSVDGSQERLYTVRLTDGASPTDLLQVLMRRSATVSLLRPLKPSLEEIFLHAVQS
ncbi:MAG: hypothetical protein CL928_12105 [Deltaproteobacteria bacterium]|nr:hypothetical protein [Deltaproteobacteria bacterium]